MNVIINQQNSHSSMTGYTLIELMVVMAIMGVLASISITALTGYTERAKTAEAMNIIPSLKLMLDTQYLVDETYPVAQCEETNRHSQYFIFSCEITPQGYLISAYGRDDAGMDGYTYTLDRDNYKTTVMDGLRLEGCWKSSKSMGC
jgi:prepilin-type N-terminal cleavage/methylation domain-containing protein